MKRKIISIPPVYFLAAILLNVLVFFILPDYNLIAFPYNLSGILLFAAGFYCMSKSYDRFKAKGTPEHFKETTCLVTDGIYMYSRNPMYLAGLLILYGISTGLGNIFGLIIPLIYFFIMNNMFIPYEEEVLEIQFGGEYKEYKKKVRAWV